MDILSDTFRLNYYLELHHDQSPFRRPKSFKVRFIIYFITIVSVTISAFLIWKSHLQNPSTAIQISCSMTHHPRLCFHSLSSTLQKQRTRNYTSDSSSSSSSTTKSNSAADPSNIFALSLQLSINELEKLDPFLGRLISTARREWTVQSLSKCKDELEKSKDFLNRTLDLIGGMVELGFRERNDSGYLMIKGSILSASLSIEKCTSLLVFTEFYDEFQTRNEVKMKLKEVGFYLDNSYLIFYSMDKIYVRLKNPSIGRILVMISHYVVVPSFVLHLAPYFFLGLLIFLMIKAKCFS